MSSSSRVIRNTFYLYIKMGVTMFVSLFSTRLILSSLGASDFGIYNVVGGAIAMLGFLNSTMANATQRFMSFAEGEGILQKKREIFNVSIILHFFIAIATAVLLIAAMYPLFHGIFNIATDRVSAAVIVYISLIISTVLTIINVPYDAVMNAHENMLYYSIVGIFESLLKLTIAFVCVNTSKDKLVVYCILMSCIPLITLSVMKVYCHRHYEECVISPRKYWDGSIVRQIASFFSWNFLTAISSLFSIQGTSVVLNHFFGTLLNASQGISNQVNGALSQFSENMKKALNPVITKNAGAKNLDAMNRATLAGCKFNSLITMIFGIPICLEINYILRIWLVEVPNWASIFVIFQIALNIISQTSCSAAIAIYAQGDIKYYAIWKSCMNIMPIFFSWIVFNFGGGPIWLYIPMIAFLGLAGNVVVIIYARKNCGIDIISYFKDVIIPITGTLIIMLLCGFIPVTLIGESLTRLILTCISTSMGMFVSCWLFAINNEEKAKLFGFFKHLLPSRIINSRPS